MDSKDPRPQLEPAVTENGFGKPVPHNSTHPTIEYAENPADNALHSIQTTLIQWLFILFGMLLYLLRKLEVPIMGRKMGLFAGTVPAECVVWTFVILEAGARDFWWNVKDIFRR